MQSLSLVARRFGGRMSTPAMSPIARALAAIALGLTALSPAPALAADIATPVYKGAPSVGSYNWAGFYVGVNGGYTFADRTMSVSPNDPGAAALTAGGLFPFPNSNFDTEGGFGGFQIGYNWQFDQRWLAGIEADFQFGSIDGTGSTAASNVFGLATVTNSEKIDWFSTVRGRLGYLLTNDFLVYATGGVAFAEIERTGAYVQPTGVGGFGGAGGFSFNCLTATCFAGEETKTRVGGTVGAGGEMRIAGNFTIKAEYLYTDFGSKTLLLSATPLPGSNPAQWAVNTRSDFHIIRLGLNYQFR